MSIKALIQNVFSKPVKADPMYREIREKNTFFLDETQHEHYKKYGYCIIENAIQNEEIDSFMHTFDEISKLGRF